MPNIRLSLCALIFASLVLSSASAQTTYTWTGQASGNWSVGSNWLGGSPPPVGGDPTGIYVFQGSGNLASLTATNDLAGGNQFNRMVFDSALTTAFTITGSGGSSILATGANAEIQQAGLGNITIAALATPTLNNNLRISGANPFGLGNITFSGAIAVGSNTLTIGNGATGNAPTANTRVIALNGQNTFAGGGVVLDGGNLSFGGTGTLNSSLGGAGGTFTVSSNGGTLQASTTIASFALGTIQVNGDLQLIGTSGITLTNTTLLSGAGNLTLRNSNSLTIQSNSTGYNGVMGTGIAALPQISAAPGTITLNGTDGALTNVTTFNIGSGGSLVLSSGLTGSTVNNNRVSDTAAVVLHSGNLSLQGAITAATTNTETIGALSGSGYSIVTATPNATGLGFTALTAASLGRFERGTFLFRGNLLGSAGFGSVGNVLFTAAPTGDQVGGGGSAGSTNISILPYAIGDTSGTGTGSTTGSFVTYGANGIRTLNTATEYQLNSFAGADANVRLNAATANAGTSTINSLLVASSGSVTGAGTLNITSGAILNQSSSATTISNNVNFGAAEGHVFATAATTISGALSGSNGLTKSGTSTLTLTGNNTGLSGQLTLNGGTLIFNSLTALPGTGQIVANGAGASSTILRYNGSSPININRNLFLGDGWLTLDSSVSASAPMTLSGIISGNGGLFVGSASSISIVELTGNNTYTGPTRVNEGILSIGSDANLGNGGGLDLFTVGSAMGTGGEGIRTTGNWTTSRHINFSNTNFVDTLANTAVWNGVVTGSGAMIKAGTGSLTINGASPYTGTVTVNANSGEVRLAQNGALLSTGFTINTGGSLVLDNTTMPTNLPLSGNVTTNRVADSATIGLATGGALRLLGNSLATVTERLGSVTVTGAGNIIQVDAVGGQSANLLLNNLIASSGSVLVRGNNIGLAGVGSHVFLNQFNSLAVTNGQFLGNVTAEDLNNLGVIESAIYDTTFGIRLANSSDFLNGTAIQNAAPTNTPTTANFRVNPSVANPVQILDAANTINSLRFAPNGVADYNGAGASTLTITSGSILTESGGGGAALTNSGAGQLTITSGSTPMTFSTNANLSVQAAIGGTGGVLKQGAGTLTLSGALNNTGTVTLAGGVVAATGGALNGNGNLGVRSIAYSGGTTTAGIEFTNTATATVGTFNLSQTIANDFRFSATGGGIVSSFSNSAENLTNTLTGVISGGNAASTIRFTGPGSDSAAFVLTNAGNTFSGTISIFEGILAATNNGALGDAANVIALNTTTSTSGGLRLDGNFTGAGALSHNLNFIDTNVINTNGNTVEATGVVSNTGTFNKIGAGTLVLANNANTHTGAVNVNAGRLLVNGNIATGTNAVTVASGATLGGTGIINRPITISSGGTLAPGASIGTLTVGNTVTVNGNGTTGGWDIELNGVATNTPGSAAGTGDVDILALSGASSNLNLVSSAGNPLRINLTALTTNFDYVGQVNYVIATANAGTNFQTNGAAFAFDPAAFSFNPTNFLGSNFQLSIDGNRLLLQFNPINPVPEPAIWTMIALAGTAGWTWKRRRRALAD